MSGEIRLSTLSISIKEERNMSIFDNAKRPIFVRGMYIFDILGESNMSQTTSAVTVVKRGKHKDSWIVLSINSGDIFECHESLLTPVVDYDADVQPLIRCQYGCTDFTLADTLAYDYMLSKFEKTFGSILDDESEPDTMKQLAKSFLTRYKELGEKIHKFAEISEYKHCLTAMKNVKGVMQEHLDMKKRLEEEDDEEVIEDRSEAEHFRDIIHDSNFFEEFNDLVNSYNPVYGEGSLTLDEFLDRALDALENDFPKEALIPSDPKYKTIKKEEIGWLLDTCRAHLCKGNIVFMVGVNSKGNQMAVAVFDICDFDEISNFINCCYDKWQNKNEPYYTDYRISVITASLNPKDSHNNEED